MPDASRLSFDVLGLRHGTIGKMTKIQLHSRLEAPIKIDLIDGQRALPAIHGGMKVKRRIEMGPIVGRRIDPFKRPSFAVRHIFSLSREKRAQLTKCFLVAEILDVRPEHLGIGLYLVLQRH